MRTEARRWNNMRKGSQANNEGSLKNLEKGKRGGSNTLEKHQHFDF
jgi:hypothetical protein